MYRTLVIMAAGMGSRFGGFKQMEPVGPSQQLLLDYALSDARRHGGFDKMVFIVRQEMLEFLRFHLSRRLGEKIAVLYQFQCLDDLPGKFKAPEGRTKPWGTAHAVWSVRDLVTEPFVVINADDFYGHDAFIKAADFLKQQTSPDKCDFGMVAYQLGKTLSKNGTVSRGICDVDGSSFLKTVREHSGLAMAGKGKVKGLDDQGSEVMLSGETLTSMNFWALTPAVFPLLEKGLVDFLKISGQDLKAECYLPAVIDKAIATNEANVTVLPTDASWCGVTYREDMDEVKETIARYTREGIYPEKRSGMMKNRC